MLRRLLDVLFDHAGRLLAGVLAIALVSGAAGLLIDHSVLVTARIWIDRSPVSLAQPSPNLSQSPGAAEAALIRELVQTDWFLGQVLQSTWPGYAGEGAGRQYQLRTDLRSKVSIVSLGDHVISVTLRAQDPEVGIRVVGRIIEEAKAATQTDPGTSAAVSAAVLQAARQDVDSSAAAVARYVAGPGHHLPDGSPVRTDPSYQTLAASAHVKSDTYLALLAKNEAAKNATTAATSAEADFRVVDAPRAQPLSLDSRSLPVRLIEAGAAVGLALAALFVYLVGVRDGRLRTPRDIERLPGVTYLVSVPRP